MATGDITISIAVAGGTTKSVTVASATRVLAKARAVATGVRAVGADLTADADYQVYIVNRFATQIVSDANQQAEQNAADDLTAQSFTAAS
jgi:hypothetical protein